MPARQGHGIGGSAGGFSYIFGMGAGIGIDPPPWPPLRRVGSAGHAAQVGRRGDLLPAPFSFAVSAFGRAAYSRAAWREASQLVGRLLGVGIRSSTPLALRLSPIFWKVLLHGGSAVTEADVAKIDIVTWHAVSTMSKLVDDADFARVGYTFSILPMFARVRGGRSTRSGGGGGGSSGGDAARRAGS